MKKRHKKHLEAFKELEELEESLLLQEKQNSADAIVKTYQCSS